MNKILRDTTGREIRVGDLIRTPHFIGARRKQYYLYRIVYDWEGYLYMISLQDATKIVSGFSKGCPVSALHDKATILCGYACKGDEISFEDRERVKDEKCPMNKEVQDSEYISPLLERIGRLEGQIESLLDQMQQIYDAR